MQTWKSAFGVIGALVPVVYFGYLFYFFFDVSDGSMKEAQDIGLGDTLLGLGVVSLLFCIPLIIKIIRLFTAPRSPGSSGRAPAPGGEDAFDADAAVARYMARRSTEAAASFAAAPPAHQGSGPARRSSFGRRTS